jgi:hypothetical protein
LLNRPEELLRETNAILVGGEDRSDWMGELHVSQVLPPLLEKIASMVLWGDGTGGSTLERIRFLNAVCGKHEERYVQFAH